MLLEREKAEHRPDRSWPANDPEIAVLLPCYNEAGGIAKVIEDFRRALPRATIYVYDNNSSDDTVQIALDAGAIVRREPRQGKGHVVRRMFADIEADIYLMCDADDTYDASAAGHLVEALQAQGLDMVVGARQQEKEGTYRPGHEFGNWMLSVLVRKIFGDQFRDMLSGYRVFSRRFVKSFPVMAGGFEIETELTIHALELEMPACEMPIRFSDRAPGSESKLRTFHDGFRILGTIINLLKQERPLQLFATFALVFSLVSIALAVPIVGTYLQTGLGLYSGRAASYLSAATFTWAVNRRFTFAAKTPPTIIEWLRYVFANTSGGLVNYLTYVALVTWGSGLLSHPALAVACGSIAGLVVNYIASARLVFGESDEKDAQPN